MVNVCRDEPGWNQGVAVWAGTTQTFDPTTVAKEMPGFAKLIIGQFAARGLIAAPKS